MGSAPVSPVIERCGLRPEAGPFDRGKLLNIETGEEVTIDWIDL
jgi:hypothetical protein